MLAKLTGLSPLRWLALCALVPVLVGLKAAHDTLGTPDVRHIAMELPITITQRGDMPLKIVLLADIHVAGPDMPPSRLMRIVEQVNSLNPDLVLIAGDLVSDKRTATRHYPTRDALAPLAQLEAKHGVIAVPGNHDHWRDMPAIAAELSRHDITLLQNEVVERAGLVIAGLDDDFVGRADLSIVPRALDQRGSKLLVLSHSPDPFPDLPDGFGIMLAGHTHCGQIAWPWGGSPATMSRYGQKYACGLTTENGNTLLTSGGLGTSVLPFRFFTKPEIWLVQISHQD